MVIPKKIKIGGTTYRVEITNKLDLGNSNVTAEIDYCNLVIRVSPQAKEKMESDFLHEVVHGILDHLGYRNHDEKKVDELAQSFYMVIQDSPGMFIKEAKR